MKISVFRNPRIVVAVPCEQYDRWLKNYDWSVKKGHEIAWYNRATREFTEEGDVIYRIDPEVQVVPDQTVTGSHVDVKPEGLGDLILAGELEPELIGELTCFCHTHPKMGPKQSTIDEENEKKLMSDGADFIVCPIIGNRTVQISILDADLNVIIREAHVQVMYPSVEYDPDLLFKEKTTVGFCYPRTHYLPSKQWGQQNSHTVYSPPYLPQNDAITNSYLAEMTDEEWEAYETYAGTSTEPSKGD